METQQGKARVGWTILVGSIAGVIFGLDPDSVTRHLSDVAQSQITQAGFFFTLAAWLHAGRVKKEIKFQFEPLTLAINGVKDALKLDLESQGKRIAGIETGVNQLTSRVDALEKTKEF